LTRRAFGARIAILAGLSLLAAACSGMPGADYFSFGAPPPPPAAQPSAVGAGQVKVALILPLSRTGNARRVAQSMRNAAEMALAEFPIPTSSFW
jgi:ABC-type branched-subunit amino acid transport system substrate-binding protein